MKLIIQANIAAIAPFELVTKCVLCGTNNFIIEARNNHPLLDWVQCLDCELWYHKDIVIGEPNVDKT